MGILQAAFKDKVFDWIGTAYTVFVNAVPSLVSYSLVLVFGSKYLGFPDAVFHPQCECFQRAAHHLPFAGIHCRLCPVDPPLHGG